MNKKVSVVVCTKNRYGFLERCINSLLNQTCFPDEIILIDNNETISKKIIIKILSKITKRKIKFKYALSDLLTTAALRNLGIKMSSHEIIAFIDDDAMAENNWIELIKKSFSRFNIQGITGTIMSSSSNSYWSKFSEKLGSFYANSYKKLELIDIMIGTNSAISRNFIEANNIYNRSNLLCGDDIDLSLQIRKAKGNILFDSRLIVWHNFRTDLRSFAIRHFDYIFSDYVVGQINKFNYDYFEYLPSKNNYFSLIFLPIKLIKRATKFTLISGIYYFPGILIREIITIYTLFYAVIYFKFKNINFNYYLEN